MSTKNDNHMVPLGVLLKRELDNEKIENPDLLHGEANHSKKGEDFTFMKTECERIPGDGSTTFSVYGVSETFLFHSFQFHRISVFSFC